MLIAKIENNKSIVGDYKNLFPNVSFPDSGPDDSFLAENNCLRVDSFISHDRNTQKLVSTEPYIVGNKVLIVKVENKTQEEIDTEINSSEISRIENINRQRANAYKNESDPIFFKWQRNEATEEEWLAKVTEIKERFPK